MTTNVTLREEYAAACDTEEVVAREVATAFETQMLSLFDQLGRLPHAADMILVADELFRLQESLRTNAEAQAELEAVRIELRDRVYG